MWPNIEKIPLFQADLPAVRNRAAHTDDRLHAVLFLLQQASSYSVTPDAPPFRQRGKAYYFTAALTALCSTGDSFRTDARKIKLSSEWEASEQKARLETDPLPVVLKAMRNHSVHVQALKDGSRPFEAMFDDKHIKFSDSSYLVPVTEADLKDRNGKTTVEVAKLDWFNRQARVWPLGNLLAEAMRQFGDAYESFLQKHPTV